eukprot:Rmarinus@m.8201
MSGIATLLSKRVSRLTPALRRPESLLLQTLTLPPTGTSLRRTSLRQVSSRACWRRGMCSGRILTTKRKCTTSRSFILARSSARGTMLLSRRRTKSITNIRFRRRPSITLSKVLKKRMKLTTS